MMTVDIALATNNGMSELSNDRSQDFGPKHAPDMQGVSLEAVIIPRKD